MLKETEEFHKQKSQVSIFTIRAETQQWSIMTPFMDKQNEGIKDPEVIGDPV